MLSAITVDPEILGGEAVFRDTRVPFQVLHDYFAGGDTLENFLEAYSSVTREPAVAAIEEARLTLTAQSKMKVLIDECAPRAQKTSLRRWTQLLHCSGARLALTTALQIISSQLQYCAHFSRMLP
jgi:uncharacterized protein (DUF433 family)